MNDRTVVTLSRPIQAFGEPVAALSLREARFQDLRGVRISITAESVDFDLGSLIPLIAKLSDLPEAAIGAISMTDLQAVAAAVLPLLSGSAASLNGSRPSS